MIVGEDTDNLEFVLKDGEETLTDDWVQDTPPGNTYLWKTDTWLSTFPPMPAPLRVTSFNDERIVALFQTADPKPASEDQAESDSYVQPQEEPKPVRPFGWAEEPRKAVTMPPLADKPPWWTDTRDMSCGCQVLPRRQKHGTY
jgi:hypothetical protein